MILYMAVVVMVLTTMNHYHVVAAFVLAESRGLGLPRDTPGASWPSRGVLCWRRLVRRGVRQGHRVTWVDAWAPTSESSTYSLASLSLSLS